MKINIDSYLSTLIFALFGSGGSSRFENRDTPGGFFTRASGEFAERLALGVPDLSSLLSDPVRSNLSVRVCPLVEAGAMNLIPDKSFLWLTYNKLYRLSLIVARSVMKT